MFLDLEGIDLDQPETECSQASLPSFSQQRKERVADMQPSSLDPNTDSTDINGQPGPPSPHSPEPEPVLDLEDSVSMSLDNHPPSTEPPKLTQPSSMWPLKFPYLSQKSDTSPNNSGPSLPTPVSRYLVIGSCVCFLAFLAYRKNSHY